MKKHENLIEGYAKSYSESHTPYTDYTESHCDSAGVTISRSVGYGSGHTIGVARGRSTPQQILLAMLRLIKLGRNDNG